MNSTQIRRRFTDFFVERNHRLVPSSPLIPNDPTLLLANAGMNQFKPYFLGEVEPDFRRATSVQKCTRTSDIEIVGDRSHATFFEMLGNFSFGDYFKEGAIGYAWELVTERFGLDPDRLWITVYLDDDEADGLWRQIGVPADRIQRLGKEDNFWSMGVAGPCGPCSEIHYDRGPSFGGDGGPASESDRYLEIWNLVFMQNIRDEDYNIIGELPEKNIDTGMGLERVAMVLQDADSMYETDLLSPVIEEAQAVSGVVYGRDERLDRSLRIVTEHGRTASFLIADGVLPSNEGRGYILRRLLRRSVRHLRLLGVEDPSLARVCSRVVANLGEAWPELVAQRSLIEQVVASEEDSFSRTLRQGSTLLEGAIRKTRDQGEAMLARRHRLPAARHLRVPLRADPGGGRRGRPGRRRRPLPAADGRPAPPGQGGPPRAGRRPAPARVLPGPLEPSRPHQLRRLRDDHRRGPHPGAAGRRRGAARGRRGRPGRADP